MFGPENARKLRESLGPVNFQIPTKRTGLLDSYCNFYGLDFGSSQQTITHSIGSITSNEFTVVCQHFQVPLAQQRGTAFLCHGYFDHAGIYNHLIEHCLRTGFSVVIFDLPGHGLSSGEVASIDSFRQYSAALMVCLEIARQQLVHSPWLLIGQSTGAAVIIDALLQEALADRHQFAAYALLAPLLRPRNWYRSKLMFEISRWFLQSTPRTFANNSHDAEFLKFLRYSDALQSQRLPRDWVMAMIDYQRRFARSPQHSEALHIIQGSGDGTVDWEYNLPKFLEKFPQAKSHMIANAGHHLVNESKPYRDKVFALLDAVINKAVN